MALLSLENAAAVDFLVYIVGFIIYVLLVWAPCALSAWLVRYYEPVSLKEFNHHWWKFKRQYIYLEIWFRTHVVLGVSVLIIFLAEGWDVVGIVVSFLFVIVSCATLRHVSRLVLARVPGSNKLKAEISGILVQHKTSRGNMHEFMKDATSSKHIQVPDQGDGYADSTPRSSGSPAHNDDNHSQSSKGDGSNERGKPNMAQGAYVQTNSQTQQTMEKQIELAEQRG